LLGQQLVYLATTDGRFA